MARTPVTKAPLLLAGGRVRVPPQPPARQRSAAGWLILLALLALAACGKKGAPVAPGPADQIIYPHTYPSL